MIYTAAGLQLYTWFTNVHIQGYMSTDRETKYSLPDSTMYNSIDEVEDWFIRIAEQIKNERTKIIMNNNSRYSYNAQNNK